MLMLKLLKIHNIVSKRDDLSGGKYLEIKASLHLFHESILFLGKEENQVLARSLSENGNSFNLTISLSTSFFFCISHESTKLFRCVAASSLGRPENWSFMTRFNKAALISQDSASVIGAIGVLIKSLLLVLEKSHNLVLSWAIMTN